MIRFPVDDVETVRTPLPTVELGRRLESLARLGGFDDARTRIAAGPARVVTDGHDDERRGRPHPLIECVHRAFAEHRPLRLSPDHVWLTIVEGVARHVDARSDELRSTLVDHDGRVELKVRRLFPPTTDADWREVLASFESELRRRVKNVAAERLSCEFSTTTDVERTAGRILVMSAFRRYFVYEFRCICGIPEVTLEGTPEDWRRLRRQTESLTLFGLGWWVDALLPILDQFVASAEGRPEPVFWRSIYKPKANYGSNACGGWISCLVPYLSDDGSRAPRRNPAVVDAPARAAMSATDPRRWSTPMVELSDLGGLLSCVEIAVVEEASKAVLDRPQLIGGVVGYAQADDGALRPVAAYGILAPSPVETALLAVLRRSDCTSKPPGAAKFLEPHSTRERGVEPDAQDVRGRPDRVDRRSSRTLNGVPLTHSEELDPVYRNCDGFRLPVLSVRASCDASNEAFGDLPDGRAVAFGPCGGLIVARPAGVADADLEDLEILAESLSTFFERLAAGAVPTSLGTVYERLGWQSHALRRSLRKPGPAVSDLSLRESRRIVMNLHFKDGAPEVLDHWWRCLAATYGVRGDRAETFVPGREPDDVMRAIGFAPP